MQEDGSCRTGQSPQILYVPVSYGRRTMWAVASVALVILATGCSSVAPPLSAIPRVEPDPAAIAKVVEDVYSQMQGPSSVFLGATTIEEDKLVPVLALIDTDLTSSFHLLSERVTGIPGASIALGRFRQDTTERLTVVASFVQEDGGGRGCTEYVLVRDGEGWVIDEAVDAWPDCPISSQGDESYHATVRRARSNECFGLWTNIGMCGPWLYVVETSGFGGRTMFFDQHTGLIVDQKGFSDLADESDQLAFELDECEPNITEQIVCLR